MNTLTTIPESDPRIEKLCFGFAAAFHAALLIWNPVLISRMMQSVTDLRTMTIVMVDPPEAAKPHRSGLANPKAITQTKPTIPILIPKTYRPMRMPSIPTVSEMELTPHTAAIPIPITITKPETVRENQKAKNPSDPSIEGPLTNRSILHKVMPIYPEWAEEQAITGTVRLYFTVKKDGRVSSNIRVEQTSGNPELDRLGIEALKQWLFSPAGTSDDQQWGVITIIFSLKR